MVQIYLSNPLKKLNLKQQLVLLFLVMVIPVFLLHAYGNERTEEILTKNVTEAYAELNKQNSILISRDIDTINRITTTIIRHPLVQQFASLPGETEFAKVQRYGELENLLMGYSTGLDGGEAVNYSLYIYDPDNYYSFAPKVSMTHRGVYFFGDGGKPPWFDEAVGLRGKGYLRIVNPFGPYGRDTTLAYIRAVYRITGNDEVIGVLFASNVEKKVQESLQSVSLPGGRIYMTDWDNRVLASTVPATGSTLEVPSGFAALAEGKESFHLRTQDSIYVVSNHAAQKQRLIYQLPVEALLHQQSELKSILQLISVAYALFGILLFIYFWRSLMAPLQKLVGFVRRYEPGNTVPDLPETNRYDEVGILMHSMHQMARRLNDLFHSQYRMEIRQKEAQLQILYQQINPHLLYNTLESIYWKSSLEGHSDTAGMIKELSKLMKISLSRGRELISLREEMEHADAYVKLQKLRYEYTFEVYWHLDPELAEVRIPKIAVQPLIENAIIHGVRNMDEDGEIHIRTMIVGDHVEVRVEDNGYKKVDYEALRLLLDSPQGEPSIGYGIRNIHERIRLHFGMPYGLRYRTGELGGTEASIVIPGPPAVMQVETENKKEEATHVPYSDRG
ncbi:histidine kinase [Gorillibacterium sp. sgz5001074]|uniref:sensor histidine kinase n=1 Tax=Gorillibacterium sp. sgz5001074 TaxID=3446695 RepID=UPI003F67D245